MENNLAKEKYRIIIKKIIPNKRIHISINNELIASSKFNIYKSSNLGETWEFCGRLPVMSYKEILSRIRLVSRLSRSGIQLIKELPNQKILICGDRSIFLTDSSFTVFQKSNVSARYFQLLDNSICVTPHYTFYGEYFPNIRRNCVKIFRTEDGLNWDTIYTFPKGIVKHIHLIQYDPFFRKIWFSTGDKKSECILGLTDLDFSDIEIIGKNELQYRSIELMFMKDKVYWGTDDPLGNNCLMSLDRNSHEIKREIEVKGPIFNIKSLGLGAILLTAAEGKLWQRNNNAHLWYSCNIDREKWTDCLCLEKDSLPFIFGFGRIQYGAAIGDNIFLSGLALKNYDNASFAIQIRNQRI